MDTLILLILCLSDISVSQQITWSRTYGDTGTVIEQGVDIVQTFDGNYVVLATRSYDNNNQKILLLKLNMYGNVMWKKMVADSILHQIPYRFQQTRDSGFIITGVGGNAFLIKTDKNGNLKWRKEYNGTYPQTYAYSVITAPDNGFIFSGSVPFFNPPSERGYVVKTDSSGSVQWERVYIDSLFTSYGELIFSNDSNSICISGGTHNITQPVTSYSVVKEITLKGDSIWKRIFISGSFANNILLLNGSTFILGSQGQSDANPIYSCLDTSGNIIWINVYEFPEFSGGVSIICKDYQNNILKVGHYFNELAFSKTSSSGKLLKLRSFSSSGFLALYSNVIKNTNDLGFMITGSVRTGNILHPYADILVLKTDSEVHCPILSGLVQTSFGASEFELFQNFPNPTNSQTTIRFMIPRKEFVLIKLYNLLGKELKTLLEMELESGEYHITISANDLESGVYFYRLESKHFSKTKKLIIIN